MHIARRREVSVVTVKNKEGPRPLPPVEYRRWTLNENFTCVSRAYMRKHLVNIACLLKPAAPATCPESPLRPTPTTPLARAQHGSAHASRCPRGCFARAVARADPSSRSWDPQPGRPHVPFRAASKDPPDRLPGQMPRPRARRRQLRKLDCTCVRDEPCSLAKVPGGDATARLQEGLLHLHGTRHHLHQHWQRCWARDLLHEARQGKLGGVVEQPRWVWYDVVTRYVYALCAPSDILGGRDACGPDCSSGQSGHC